jgi:hypothetical protein
MIMMGHAKFGVDLTGFSQAAMLAAIVSGLCLKTDGGPV